jgi:hypothetical protein
MAEALIKSQEFKWAKAAKGQGKERVKLASDEKARRKEERRMRSEERKKRNNAEILAKKSSQGSSKPR